MTVYHNHLKREYAVEKGDKSLIITASSCYMMSAEALALIELLPSHGRRECYIQEMQALGIERAELIFDKLLDIDALVVKAPKKIYKRIFASLLMPEIKLFSSRWQEPVFNAVEAIIKQNWRSLLCCAGLAVLFSFIVSFTSLYSVLLKISSGQSLSFYLLAIILLSSLIHEIGHSFAAAVVGIGLRPIGFSVYLFYPVFYTNVSGMEKLSLQKKILVDCGGFIAQSLFLLVLWLLWFLSKNLILLESVRWISLIVAFNFNPLLRTDGYWLYQDIRKDFANNKILLYLHYIYIAAFLAFTIYLFRHFVGRATDLYTMVRFAYENPNTLFSQSHKIVLAFYLLIMFLVGGSRRLQEVGRELSRLLRIR